MNSVKDRDHLTVKQTKGVSSTVIVCVLAVVCATAIGTSLWFNNALRKTGTESNQTASVPVEVAKPQMEDFPVYLDGLGVVQALNTITIRTRIDGQLQKVLFTEGQEVKKGDLLAVVDPRPYQAALDQAAAKSQQDQADLANAQYILARDEKLGKQGVTPAETVETQQSLVDGLTAQLAQDNAAEESARVSLSYSQITSPIDGRTGIRLIDAGNQVHTNDATGIVVVTQTQPISVISSLNEEDLSAVRAAMQKGPVEVTALTSDRLSNLGTGTLTLIDNEIDPASGTMRLKSTFQNEGNTLWPGQFVTLQVRSATILNAITVPSSSLERGPDGFFVYVVNDDSTVGVRKVIPGPIDDSRVVVSNGLSGSELVVTEGQYRLADGTRVSAKAVSASETVAGK